MTNTITKEDHQLREIKIERNYTAYAEGSVKISYGNTVVICNASVTQGVPKFLKGTGKGWVTAEYGMLPRSTHDRMNRESAKGKLAGRTMEIQRLIGRSLRSIVDTSLMPDYTIQLDCDVIQADGGTRTASITGAAIALHDAIKYLLANKMIRKNPFKLLVAAVSVGIVDGKIILDLDYSQDSNAETDLNVVMLEDGGLIEVQGTAEKKSYSRQELNDMLDIATKELENIFAMQKKALDID